MKNPFKVLACTHHLHHTSACLAARRSDTTCQKSWQLSDALMEPNVPQQIRDGRVVIKPRRTKWCGCCRTAARLCDGVQKPSPARASPFLSDASVYVQRKESRKQMVNSFKVDVFLMGLGWSRLLMSPSVPPENMKMDKPESVPLLLLSRY